MGEVATRIPGSRPVRKASMKFANFGRVLKMKGVRGVKGVVAELYDFLHDLHLL